MASNRRYTRDTDKRYQQYLDIRLPQYPDHPPEFAQETQRFSDETERFLRMFKAVARVIPAVNRQVEEREHARMQALKAFYMQLLALNNTIEEMKIQYRRDEKYFPSYTSTELWLDWIKEKTTINQKWNTVRSECASDSYADYLTIVRFKD